jgi:urease accessory protein
MARTTKSPNPGFPIPDDFRLLDGIDFNCRDLSGNAEELTLLDTRASRNRLRSVFSGGRTRLVECLAEPPVRFVQPKVEGESALVFVSAFGGGMLEGDDYRFDLACGEDSTLMFAPQANTRIFPCPHGIMSRQHIHGTVYARGTAVSGGDPVVLYADSRFRQTQTWTLHPGARLVLMDWMVAGRLERDENFAFERFESAIRIEDPEGRPLLADTLTLIPAENAAAGMGGFSSHLSVYVAGAGWEDVHRGLDAFLRAAEAPGGRPAWMEASRVAGLGVREGTGFSLRALGRDRAALEPLAEKLFELLASKRWLGFDYWKRKY